MKSSKMSKERNALRKVGNHWWRQKQTPRYAGVDSKQRKSDDDWL